MTQPDHGAVLGVDLYELHRAGAAQLPHIADQYRQANDHLTTANDAWREIHLAQYAGGVETLGPFGSLVSIASAFLGASEASLRDTAYALLLGVEAYRCADQAANDAFLNIRRHPQMME